MSVPGLDALLQQMRRDGWESYVFGPRDAPHAVSVVHRWTTCADVLVLRAEDDATAYRTPLRPDADLFAPTTVSWHYHATAEWTVRAVLDLAEPGTPGSPMAVLTPPPDCGVPAGLRRTTTIRLHPRRTHAAT
ncbi:hypothetical protein [Saccharopolyspora rhizosphaerae]|uniref:hypothetical protein n=1 Tax=Saccharopolyspora rhizosphaerae TaxID=2492662 RepID=UPI001F44B793|nr:hypothetical protein [Saccharopolyspora rhizosphaerae]